MGKRTSYLTTEQRIELLLLVLADEPGSEIAKQILQLDSKIQLENKKR